MSSVAAVEQLAEQPDVKSGKAHWSIVAQHPSGDERGVIHPGDAEYQALFIDDI